MEEKNPIQVADRLFSALETLADEGPVSLAELSSRLSLKKSTAHRLLCSLIYMGYVKQDIKTQKYDLSLKLLTLSNRLLNRMDILETVRPHLKELAKESGETVHFVRLDGAEAVYMLKEESLQNSVRLVSKVGSRIPFYCSGVGKAIAAGMSGREVEKLWKQSDIRPLTPKTITDLTEFQKALQEVNAKGYALDDEENETGVRCIAVSIPDYQGNFRYAFSISAPISRMPEEQIDRLSRIILEKKQAIIKELAK